MPALDIEDLGVPPVASFGSLLKSLLDEAEALKPPAIDSTASSTIDPPIYKHDLPNLTERISSALVSVTADPNQDEETTKMQLKTRKYAAIEAVAREFFSRLVALIPIDSPEAVNVWNFLDILDILSDEGHCDPALLFWLIEELLDSQTIAGCRIIFDYLESRRERITAKNFKSSNLVILRTCNELLRRLSRAEDTAFCGRVFIFLFQSFPLGDRSSVNLRGEYHVENVTTFEAPPEEESTMDVDTQDDTQKEGADGKPDPKKKPEPLPSDELYYLFWPLQDSFSQPLKLFEAPHFQKFQRGVEETVRKFMTYSPDEGFRPSNTLEEPVETLKRKRGQTSDDEQPESFNPKYLTSKDLFELEVGDLAFRRHIFLQILITLNFVLSWTPEAKKKLESMNVSNKSIMYSGEFNDDQAEWAKETKKRILNFVGRDKTGRPFHRLITTVLSRDRNWIYWKLGGCERIQRDPVAPETWVEAQSTVKRSATSKRLRPVPMNAVSMDFLKEQDQAKVMEELRDPERYQIPGLDTFKAKIADDDFDMSMAATDQAKARVAASKASKSWRAMRIARGFKLAAFDKVDDPSDISAVFKSLDELDAEEEDNDVASEEDMPTNRETIIIAGPPGIGKAALVDKLMEVHKGVFGRVIRHTTRDPAEGEAAAKAFFFVKPLEFNQLRDGDRLIEYSEQGDVSYGTSSKAIETVSETGKIPIIELDTDSAKFAKDMMDFPGRYILLKPSSPSVVETRLKEAGKYDEASIKAIVDQLPKLDDDSTATLFDKVLVVGDDLDEITKVTGGFVYNKDGQEGQKEVQQGDDVMEEGKDEEKPKGEEKASEDAATTVESMQVDEKAGS